jgi:hypothetical protein
MISRILCGGLAAEANCPADTAEETGNRVNAGGRDGLAQGLLKVFSGLPKGFLGGLRIAA